MYPSVQKWYDRLSGWQKVVYKLLSFVGQEERAYHWFGYYQQNPK